jgi:hypothetical protein
VDEIPGEIHGYTGPITVDKNRNYRNYFLNLYSRHKSARHLQHNKKEQVFFRHQFFAPVFFFGFCFSLKGGAAPSIIKCFHVN